MFKPKKALHFCEALFSGADRQTRTADLILTKDVLYHLSHISILNFSCKRYYTHFYRILSTLNCISLFIMSKINTVIYVEILKIVFTSAFSVIALFLLTKLMGKKQISQLNLFDYINGITIGSIAAEMATAIETDFWLPLTAMTVYAFFSLLLSYLERKSSKLNRFFVGDANILLEDGVLYEKNLIRSKISVNEFLSQCRTSGYFNISDIQTAVLEPNGIISFLPKADAAPLTPADMNIQKPESEIIPNVIVDGNILSGNLRLLGVDEVWLLTELMNQGISSPDKVFLATCDKELHLSVYVKVDETNCKEPFM